MVSAPYLFGVAFYLLAYIVFAFWFFAKVTKGFITNPRRDGTEYSFREVWQEIDPGFLYGVLVYNIGMTIIVIFMNLVAKIWEALPGNPA